MSEPTAAESPIPALAAKLAEVRRRGLTCFGSQKHRFQWNPPLAEEDVRTFEERHGITLPSDYRRFLLEAGNGGAGPDYGILPLEGYNYTIPDEEFSGYLARPSPFRPSLPILQDIDEWEKVLGCPFEAFFQGTIALVEQGCSYYANLVVAGPNRGRVIYLDQSMVRQPYFVRHDDFLTWYERWLDELLAGLKIDGFGYGYPGSETELAAVLAQSANPVDVRVDALISLARFPVLEAKTLELIQDQLGDGSSCVRSRAIKLLAWHNHPEAVKDLARLANDPDGSARTDAVVALARRANAPWDLIRIGLNDCDQNVVRETLYALERGRVLTAGDVRRFLASSDSSQQLWALRVGRSLPPNPATAALVMTLLASPSMEVRRSALWELGRQGAHGVVPTLLAHWTREGDLEVVDTLIQNLGSLGDRQSVPALIAATRSMDAFTRFYAAEALGKLGDSTAIPALRALLADWTRPKRRSSNGSESSHDCRVADRARAALEALSGDPGRPPAGANAAGKSGRVTRRGRWWPWWRG